MGHNKAGPPDTNTFCDCQVTTPTLEEKEERGRTRKGRNIIPPSQGENRHQVRARSYNFPEDTTSIGIMVFSFRQQASAGAVRHSTPLATLKTG